MSGTKKIKLPSGIEIEINPMITDKGFAYFTERVYAFKLIIDDNDPPPLDIIDITYEEIKNEPLRLKDK